MAEKGRFSPSDGDIRKMVDHIQSAHGLPNLWKGVELEYIGTSARDLHNGLHKKPSPRMSPHEEDSL